MDYFGRADAPRLTAQLEIQGNRERHTSFKRGQQVFDNSSVGPPATTIVHHVNLEYLARVVMLQDGVADAPERADG